MAKSSGLGERLFVAGYDLSGDTQSLDNVSGGNAPIDVTDITQSANSRLGGQRDGKFAYTAYFDPGVAANAAHTILSALPTADQQIMYCIAGPTIGNPASCIIGKQLNYDGTRGRAGDFTFKVEADANSFGLEWGTLLTAGLRTDSAATAGASIDTTASAAFGFQAYLQVAAFAGTDATVKIQDSADNSTFADLASGAFTQITSTTPGTQRIAVGGTAAVRRYIKATTITTGGFTNLQFALVIVKNLTAVTF